MAQDAGRVALEPGVEREHHVPFAFADLRREGDSLGHRLDELANRARRVREPDVSERRKPVSFAAACWSKRRASVARSFSARSRPFK